MSALFRTELVKAVRRTRTMIGAGLLIALPALIVWAIHQRPGRPDNPDRAFGLFRLAHQSGLLVPASVLNATDGFLLVVMAGLLAGDTVASDASWGNLRYLLLRPVGRLRLLAAKTGVTALLIWASVTLVALSALVAGLLAFGSHPLVVPSFPFGGPGGGPFVGYTLSTSALLLRTVIATAYVAASYTALLGVGVFLSTVIDVPSGAIGAAIGVYIVSQILDGITALGQVRYGFPTHYLDAWQPMFTENRYPHDMAVGMGVQVAWLVVFGTAACVWFARKDIRT